MSRYNRGEVTPMWVDGVPTGQYDVSCNCGPIAIVDSLAAGLEIAAAHDAARHPNAEKDYYAFGFSDGSDV